MGSVQFPKLSCLARETWQFCESRDIWLVASYINTKNNEIADSESRQISENTEWKLSPRYSEEIITEFAVPSIDLFATNINKKSTKIVSWHKDLDSWADDAFTVSW